MRNTCLISEDEYVRANKLFTRLSRRQKVYYALASAVLLGLVVFAKSNILQFEAFFVLVGGVLGHLVMRHGIAPWQTRRQYRVYRAAQEPFDIELEGEGLRFSGPNNDSLLKWGHLMRWRENQEFVLVYQNPRLYHIVPKRLSSDGFDIEALISNLERGVGNAT